MMTRSHIHCAAGLSTDKQVISGMRKSCDVFVYIDAASAMEAGVPFFLSTNGVILTPGLEGVLAPQFFAQVTDREGNDLLPTP